MNVRIDRISQGNINHYKLINIDTNETLASAETGNSMINYLIISYTADLLNISYQINPTPIRDYEELIKYDLEVRYKSMEHLKDLIKEMEKEEG